MIVNLLRAFYVLLPIGVVVWVMVANESFTKAISYANSLQGESGLLVINKAGRETRGTQVEKFLSKTFSTQDENWRNVYRSIGYQTDIAIRHIQNYWLWGSVATLLLLGIFYLLARKDYK